MPSVANIAAQNLQRRITTGEFALGSTLPSQRELADSLGISRASLREAISTLEALGLVRSQAGRGVFVTYGARPEPADLPRAGGALTPQALYELRYTLEPAWCSLAAARISSAEIDELERIEAAMEAALRVADLVGASERDLEFHIRLAEMSGSQGLVAAAHQFRDLIAHCLRLPFANASAIWAPADEHKRILAALTAGDPALAAEAMRAHLDAAANRVGVKFSRPA